VVELVTLRLYETYTIVNCYIQLLPYAGRKDLFQQKYKFCISECYTAVTVKVLSLYMMTEQKNLLLFFTYIRSVGWVLERLSLSLFRFILEDVETKMLYVMYMTCIYPCKISACASS
jgi:hypothetical protein